MVWCMLRQPGKGTGPRVQRASDLGEPRFDQCVDEQARECLPMYEELGHLTLIGHSHLCKVFALTPNSVEELPPIDFELQPDRKYIVSVGSVGQPRDYDNRASYTLFDSTKKRFEFKRVEYDIETAADKVLRAKLERNFAHRLFIGV